MTARRLQTLPAAVFLLLGGWCVLAPGMVVRLTFLDAATADTGATRFVMGCFGAQAALTGTILLMARSTPTTFLVFGLAGSLPFFAFNLWYTLVEPVLNGWMWLDVLGNVTILGCGLSGWHLARRERVAAASAAVP